MIFKFSNFQEINLFLFFFLVILNIEFFIFDFEFGVIQNIGDFGNGEDVILQDLGFIVFYVGFSEYQVFVRYVDVEEVFQGCGQGLQLGVDQDFRRYYFRFVANDFFF